jgi:2,5-furandicarboxylate decarboxylase 1
MGIDATKPLKAPEMVFKRIHVPGEEAIDVAEVLKRSGGDWRAALKS